MYNKNLILLILIFNLFSSDSSYNKFCCYKNGIYLANIGIGLGGCDLKGFCKIFKSNICGPVNAKGYFFADYVNFESSVKVDSSNYDLKKLVESDFSTCKLSSGSLKSEFLNLLHGAKVAFCNCNLYDNLLIRSLDLLLSNTKVKKNIIFFKDENYYGNHILYILSNTIVDGDINFKNCSGVIYIDFKSKINGSVIGKDIKIIKYGRY